MSYYSVHTPLQAPADTVAKYKDIFGLLEPKTEFIESEQVWPVSDKRLTRMVQAHATYAAMVEHVDRNIGRILNTLEKLNLREDTIIVLHSDNGGLSSAEGSPTSNLPLRGGKGWLYEGGIRVPFVISVPGSASVGKTSNTPVSTMDIAATIYDLVGVEVNKNISLDGTSLLGLINQNSEIKSRPLIFHYPHYSNQGGFPGAVIREGDWKLIERFEDGSVQLFNLAEDLGETTDLSSIDTERVNTMRSQLHEWYERKNASFLLASPKRPQYGAPWHPKL